MNTNRALQLIATIFFIVAASYLYLRLFNFICHRAESMKNSLTNARLPCEIYELFNKIKPPIRLMAAFLSSLVTAYITLISIMGMSPEIYLADSNKEINGDLISPATLEIKTFPPFCEIYYTTDGTNPEDSSSKMKYDNESKIVLYAGEGGTVYAKAKFLFVWSKRGERSQRIFDEHVSDNYIELQNISFESFGQENEVSIELGKTVHLNLLLAPNDATEKQFFWESDNPSIASVQGTGILCSVTGHSEGVVRITATSIYDNRIRADILVKVISASDQNTHNVMQQDKPTDLNPASSSSSMSTSQVTYRNHILEYIKLISPPTKRNYFAGETLDTDGLQILAYYNDESYLSVDASNCTILPKNLNTIGHQKVTVYYEGKITYFYIDVESTTTQQVLSDISIDSLPNKTSYILGEKLDTTGLVVKANYSNGHTSIVTNDCSFTPSILNSIGEQKINVTYSGKTVSFFVDVKDSTEQPTLLNISIESPPDKTSYILGETLNITGLVVKANYNNGNTVIITNDCNIAPSIFDSIGNQKIIVTYHGKTTFFNVNVESSTLQSTLSDIYIDSPPNKTNYILGEKLDITGLVVRAIYDNGNVAVITNSCNITPSSLDSVGMQKISVTYMGKTTFFHVNVERLNIQPTLSNIYMESLPTKVTYSLGENLDIKGMIVKALYSDGSTVVITDRCEVAPVTLNSVGSQEIIVTYNGINTSFYVDVQNKPIQIISCDYKEAYKREMKQSFFTLNIETNVNISEVKLSTMGQTYSFDGYGLTDISIPLDRKSFSLSSYNFSIIVSDDYGNQDTEEMSVLLEEISISLSETHVELPKGTTITLTANVTGLAGHSVDWTSSNLAIADIRKETVLGEAYSTVVVTAQAEGTATITASVAGRKCTCIIDVS